MNHTTTPEERPKKSPRWRRWAVDIAIFVALFAGFQMWQLRDTARGPAPVFDGQRVDGSHFDLAAWRAEHPGQPVLLYFWAEWCPVCKTTAGNVSALAKDWPVTTIATQSGNAQAVAATMFERDYAWPTVVDERGGIMQSYGLPGTPAFVVIAPDGDIRFVSVGYTSELGLRLRLWWAGR